MFRWRLSALTAIVILIVTPLAAARPGDDKEDADPAVQYRIDVMKGIAANAAAIGLTLRYQLPQTQNIALHAQAIALGARAAASAFGPKAPGGVAKPEVWDNWTDFSARLTKLADAADAVAKVAREQSPDAARPQLEVMLPMCKSCHDEYRKK